MHTLPGVPFSFFTTAHEPRRPISGLVPGNYRDVPATFRFIPPCALGKRRLPFPANAHKYLHTADFVIILHKPPEHKHIFR